MPEPIYFEEIRALLPYSPPLILIDQVVDWAPLEWILVSKVVSGADPLVNAHFPNGPAIMPGVLLIELVGQAGLLLGILSAPPDAEEKSLDVLGRCKARFYRMVRAGETIAARVTREAGVSNVTLFKGEVMVREELVARIEVYVSKQ